MHRQDVRTEEALRYSIEFEPSEATNAIRILHLVGRRNEAQFMLKAYWSKPANERRVGVQVECGVKELLGLWRHLRDYVRRPRVSSSGAILPCVYDLPIVRYHVLLTHHDGDGHRELARHVSGKKNLHIQLATRSDVPLLLRIVGDLLQYSTGWPPRY